MLFYNKYLPKLSREKEKNAYESILSKISRIELYPGVVNLLKKFKNKGINMVIVSSDPIDKVFVNIKKYNLKKIFKEIYFNIYDKPEIANEVVKQNQFHPAETVFIGDTVHDIKAGKSAGIKTIGVSWGLHSEKNYTQLNQTS